MDEADSFENLLQDTEFSVLIPALALLSSAHTRAAELGYGFELENGNWKISWPEEVINGFGIQPTQFYSLNEKLDIFRVHFEPPLSLSNSYWRHIFGSAAPSLVVSYEVRDEQSSAQRPIAYPIDEEWLHWSWHVSREERLALLKRVVIAQEEFSDVVGWLDLAQRSIVDGPRSLLFRAVFDHFSRERS